MIHTSRSERTRTEVPRRRAVSLLALAFGLVAAPAASAGPQPPADGHPPRTHSPGAQLIAVGRFPGDASDLAGLVGALEDGTPGDRLGSLGSAIARAGGDDRYVMLADRGPGDGATAYRCRLHIVEMRLPRRGPDPGSAPVDLSPRLVSTVPLSDGAGRPFVGAASAIDPEGTCWSDPRLDPEGIRPWRDGSWLVAEEYGPRILVFGASGTLLGALPVPERFGVDRRSGEPAGEMPPHNRRGRQANRGFEGLAVSPDGSRVYAVLQSPLLQDGALDDRGRRAGTNVRILEIATATGDSREWAYPLSSPAHGLSEILAVDADRFLVIERDGQRGAKAKAKWVTWIDLAAASDVRAIESLPPHGLPEGLAAPEKRVAIDLLDPAFGLAGASMPEKIEGLCFGPDLDDGRRTLLVSTDNDFRGAEPTWVWVFALDPAVLDGGRR